MAQLAPTGGKPSGLGGIRGMHDARGAVVDPLEKDRTSCSSEFDH